MTPHAHVGRFSDGAGFFWSAFGFGRNIMRERNQGTAVVEMLCRYHQPPHVGDLIVDAIARAKSADRKAIVEALKASDFKGLAGEIKFTDKNTLQTSNFRPVVAKGGKWVAAE